MDEGWKQLKGPLIAVVLALAASAWFWPSLPDMVPTHWNSAGDVNGTMPKQFAVFVMPAFMFLLVFLPWLLVSLMRLGRLSRQEPDRRDEARAGTVVATALTIPLLAIHIAMLLKASGSDIDIIQLTQLFIALSLIPLGNLVGKLRRNAFVGIRTPWAYADDEVWLHTQRFGGRLLMLAGLLIAALTLAGFGHFAMKYTLTAVVIMTVGYSWWTHRRLVTVAPPSQ